MGNAEGVTEAGKMKIHNKVVKYFVKIIERTDDIHMNIKHWQESLENNLVV